MLLVLTDFFSNKLKVETDRSTQLNQRVKATFLADYNQTAGEHCFLIILVLLNLQGPILILLQAYKQQQAEIKKLVARLND